MNGLPGEVGVVQTGIVETGVDGKRVRTVTIGRMSNLVGGLGKSPGLRLRSDGWGADVIDRICRKRRMTVRDDSLLSRQLDRWNRFGLQFRTAPRKVFRNEGD